MSLSEASVLKRDPETPCFSAQGPEARATWQSGPVAAQPAFSLLAPSHPVGCESVLDSSRAAQTVVQHQLGPELAL